jgi:hypothetical protein
MWFRFNVVQMMDRTGGQAMRNLLTIESAHYTTLLSECVEIHIWHAGTQPDPYRTRGKGAIGRTGTHTPHGAARARAARATHIAGPSFVKL